MIAATGSPQSGTDADRRSAGGHHHRALRGDRHPDGVVGATDDPVSANFSKPRCSRPALPSCIRTPRIISCTANRRAHRQRASQSRALTRSSRREPTTFSSASAMTAPSASSPRKSASPNSAPIRALRATRIASPTAMPCARNSPPCSASTTPTPLCDRLLAAGLPAGPVQSIDQALTSSRHAVHRGDVIEKDWYKGVASPIRLARSKPSLRSVPPEIQPAWHRGAHRVRLFEGRDRRLDCRGDRLRRRDASAEALRALPAGLALP